MEDEDHNNWKTRQAEVIFSLLAASCGGLRMTCLVLAWFLGICARWATVYTDVDWKIRKLTELIIWQLIVSDICSRFCHVSQIMLSFFVFFFIENLYEAFTMCYRLLRFYRHYKVWQTFSGRCQSIQDNIASMPLTTTHVRGKWRPWHETFRKKYDPNLEK